MKIYLKECFYCDNPKIVLAQYNGQSEGKNTFFIECENCYNVLGDVKK